LQLDPGNVSKGLNALLDIGYQDVRYRPKAEDFANPKMRGIGRQNKGMITLKLWRDRHQRNAGDIFVYEPFDFAKNSPRDDARSFPRRGGTLVSLETLLMNEARRCRAQDLIDMRNYRDTMKPLERIRPDWKWGTSDGIGSWIGLLDGQLTFREKLEWLEEAETLSLRLRAIANGNRIGGEVAAPKAIQKLSHRLV